MNVFLKCSLMAAGSLLPVIDVFACKGIRQEYKHVVVLKGVEELRSTPIDRVEAYRRDNRVWTQVPIQIDEVNAAGDYVLSEGIPFTSETDDRFYDGNDELVIRGESFGGSFGPEALSDELKARGLKFWRVDLCRQGAYRGSLLLIRTRNLAEPLTNAKVDVDFDPKQKTLKTSLYHYRFLEDHPAMLGGVELVNGDSSSPVIGSSKFVMPLRTAWYLPNITFYQDDFTSEIESWQVGPLRTIVAVGVKYQAFLGLFKLHLFSELVFYRDQFEIPTVIEFIFDPRRYLRPGSGLGYMIAFPADREWQIDSNIEPLPETDPDSAAQGRKRANLTTKYHARGSRPEGSFAIQVRVDPRAAAQVPPPFLFHEEQRASDSFRSHWPWLAELSGDLGVFVDFSGLKQGVYDFGLDLVLSSEANESFEDRGFLETKWQSLTP